MTDATKKTAGGGSRVPPGRAGNGNGNGANGDAGGAAPGGRKSFLPELNLRLPPWVSQRLRPRLPGLAVIFQKDSLVLVHMERGTRGAAPSLSHISQHKLPEGTLTPGLSEANFSAPAEASARLGRALDALPNRRKLNRISIVLADVCARVILLDLQAVPHSGRQAEQMIRWQVRKRVPFKLDEARMAIQRFPLAAGGERVAVVLGLERILGQYEQVVSALGLKPGLLDLATLNMANLCVLERENQAAADAGDVAILNVADEEFSIFILRDGIPLFYRSRPLLHDLARQPRECLGDVRRELITSSAYYRDRLGGAQGGIRRVWLRVAGQSSFPMEDAVKSTLGTTAERIHPQRLLPLEGMAAADPGLLELAAPALGITAGRWS
jgi:Tfp pilus assembly PilM family ATPase